MAKNVKQEIDKWLWNKTNIKYNGEEGSIGIMDLGKSMEMLRKINEKQQKA